MSKRQSQPTTVLRQPRRSTNYKCHSQPTTVLHRTSPTKTINQLQMSLTTNNSPSQGFTNQDDQPPTNVTHNQQQSFTGLHQPRRSTNYKHTQKYCQSFNFKTTSLKGQMYSQQYYHIEIPKDTYRVIHH